MLDLFLRIGLLILSVFAGYGIMAMLNDYRLGRKP